MDNKDKHELLQMFLSIVNYIKEFLKLDIHIRREKLLLIQELLKKDNFKRKILVKEALQEMKFIIKLYNCSESKKVMSLFLNRKNSENKTALDLAREYDLTEFIKELEKYG